MIQFRKGAGENQLSFPLTKAQINKLKPCSLVSPRIGKENDLVLPERLSTEAGLVGAAHEVLNVRRDVEKGRYPHWFMEKYWPKEWGDYYRGIPKPLLAEGLRESRPEKCADIVHMDHPFDLGKAIQLWLLGKGYAIKDGASNYKEFVGSVASAGANMAIAVENGLMKAFEAKYQFGVARPEEVISAHGIGPDASVTHYKEGSPCHPSFPAGHGAAAGSTGSYLIDAFDLDQLAIHEIRASCYCWAMWRTFAGVHYAEDNLAGLKIGGLQEAI